MGASASKRKTDPANIDLIGVPYPLALRVLHHTKKPVVLVSNGTSGLKKGFNVFYDISTNLVTDVIRL